MKVNYTCDVRIGQPVLVEGVYPMYCYKCGNKVLKSHKYCSSCGEMLNWDFNKPVPSLKSPIQSPTTPVKTINIIDLFNKMESTLKRQSKLSNEEFEIHWGKFKKYHYSIYDDGKIYRIFVGVVFYSGFKAGTVTAKLPEIYTYLGDYNIVKDYSKQDIDRILKNPGVIRNRSKIQACVNIARRFASVLNQYGSFKNYLESFGDLTKDSTLEKVRNALMEFEFIGPVTSYHVMLDLGLNVWKPDVVICRILKRLGLLSDSNNKDGAVKIGKIFSGEIGLPIRYIDIVMAKYGQKGPEEPFGLDDGICLEKNPRCNICGITEYCIHRSKNINYKL